jgi:DNA-binding NarL/FixJ family response regulator
MKELRILVADDQTSFRQRMQEMTHAIPWTSIVAKSKNGLETIELVKRHRPDVVLMDIVMPGIDGIEATRRIKEIAPQTKVIAITAYDNAEFPKRSIEAGADLFIKKEELDSETLRKCLEKLRMDE